MLEELYVKDFALIHEQRISFGKGLNIITGETGAGKSILLGALNLVLGSKATTDLIRSGSHRSVVEAVFRLSVLRKEVADSIREILEDAGLFEGDDEIILRREISTEGRGRSFINARQVPVSLLKTVGRQLVDIHGQNENQNILQIATHREILDRFAGITEQVEDLKQLHEKYQNLEQKLMSVSLDEEEKNRRMELLRHDIAEIEEAELTTQADFEELLSREKSLENAEAILQAISQVYGVIQEDEDSILQRLAKADFILNSNVDFEPALTEPLDRIREASIHLEEAASSLREIADNLQVDPEEKLMLQERIDLIQNILRKHGPSIEDAKAYYEQAVNELSGIELSGEEAARIQKELTEIKKKLVQKASEVSLARRKAAERLEKEVHAHLSDLGMGETQFKISIKWEKNEAGLYSENTRKYMIYPTGLDIVEFLIAASEKETLRPLRKIASGGEMSRIMLALKSVIVQNDPVGTMIFDEVDTGVGGRVAEAVGHKLSSLSKNAQVIVITHLHQVAGMNPPFVRHFNVSRDKKAGTAIRRLTEKQRIEELARMIGGEKITESAMKHAQEILAQNKGK
ncbi:MAG: DNA repair protein RecN [Candidatus Hydrogenedentota bacterium]|nr:MAG: DNA repair protein RecN [Candidatus Hydrogenedentota bacterium]